MRARCLLSVENYFSAHPGLFSRLTFDGPREKNSNRPHNAAPRPSAGSFKAPENRFKSSLERPMNHATVRARRVEATRTIRLSHPVSRL